MSCKEWRIHWWLLIGKNSGMWNIGKFWYSYKWISNTQKQTKKSLLQTEHVLLPHLFCSPSLECLLFSHNVSEKNMKDLSYKEQFHRHFKEHHNLNSPQIQSSNKHFYKYLQPLTFCKFLWFWKLECNTSFFAGFYWLTTWLQKQKADLGQTLIYYFLY